MNGANVLWRKVDSPGHEACELSRAEGGWRLKGASAFEDEASPAYLAYEVIASGDWRSMSAKVNGRVGAHRIDVVIERDGAGRWTLNGVPSPELDDCPDIDLSFSPATNLIAINRLALKSGQAGSSAAAWFNHTDGALSRLDQRYELVSDGVMRYTGVQVPYHHELRVHPSGFVLEYPGLWEAIRVVTW